MLLLGRSPLLRKLELDCIVVTIRGSTSDYFRQLPALALTSVERMSPCSGECAVPKVPGELCQVGSRGASASSQLPVLIGSSLGRRFHSAWTQLSTHNRRPSCPLGCMWKEYPRSPAAWLFIWAPAWDGALQSSYLKPCNFPASVYTGPTEVELGVCAWHSCHYSGLSAAPFICLRVEQSSWAVGRGAGAVPGFGGLSWCSSPRCSPTLLLACSKAGEMCSWKY